MKITAVLWLAFLTALDTGNTAAQTSKTGYVRNRDQEFIQKGIARKELEHQLNILAQMVKATLNEMTTQQMNAEYPLIFDDKKVSNSYLLVQLLAHLNYHLGQVNYLRRVLE
jgi:hypothetical protein